jgi:hypothetical protein
MIESAVFQAWVALDWHIAATICAPNQTDSRSRQQSNWYHFAVTRNVGHLSDVIEHVSARKQENGDETYRGPQVPVLDHGKDVARGDTKEGYQA